MLGRAEWGGNARLLQEALVTLKDLRAVLSGFPTDSQGTTPWMEDVWPLVQFALCSGFRLKCAVHGMHHAQVQAGDAHSILRHSVVPATGSRAVFSPGHTDTLWKAPLQRTLLTSSSLVARALCSMATTRSLAGG